MALKTLEDLDFTDKTVFVRFDFNVPLDEKKHITDTTRIDLAIPTIEYLLNHDCKKLILCSHLGRPKGVRDDKFSLEPVATYLASKLDQEVLLTDSAVDCGMRDLLKLQKTKIFMLENIRFHKEETENDHNFAKTLAGYADIYVNDAFGTCHRKHASTYGITEFHPKTKACGFLIEKEIAALDKILESPTKPFVALVGGAKVADKIKMIEKLLPKVDKLLIGGAMAYPFLKAKNLEVGKSLCSSEDVSLARKILAKKTSGKIVLPVDHLVAGSPDEKASLREEPSIPENKMGLDIGPKTMSEYQSILKEAKTILWNGPMGFFEKEEFANGTYEMAKAIANSSAYSLVGGGDSVSALNKSGLADKISHVSTGGGASLQYIEEGSLPGIAALKFGVSS
jgi:phosphoglycerate kinase